MAKVIGYLSENVMSKALEAQDTSKETFFTARSHSTEKCIIPVYLGEPANDNLEAQKKLTGYLVAQAQLQKLYVELTNGDPVGEQWDDGDFSHKGYLITNEQLERLGELVGYVEPGK